MGRPKKYTDDTRVTLHARSGARLNRGSDRRAIVEVLLERGGTMTLGELDEHFGFSVRAVVYALERSQWVELES